MNFFKFFKKKPTIEENEAESSLESSINEMSQTEIVPSSQNRNQLEFVDSSKLVFASLPIRLAKDVPINSKKMHDDNNEKFLFPICPGTFDYSRLGYIMPSWTDFHFKVNKAGTACIVGGGKKESQFRAPYNMDPNIVKGIFKLHDNIQLRPMNLSSPWKVFSYDKDISALLLPAWYHADPEFLDNFYVYSGIVDYNSFHTANVIMSPKRKFQYTIKAGDPLVHIIPFYNKPITCGYGPPNIEQESLLKYDPTWHEKNYYRKNHMQKKSFKLKETEETEETKE